MVNIDIGGVRLSGPLFDGTSLRVIAAMMTEADDLIAARGLELVDEQFHQNFQNPTGAYESRTVVTQRGHNTKVITDQGTVYGPWLEGTSSRNQTTRFKGYSDFRKAAQQLDREATGIAQGVVNRRIGQLQ